MDFKVIIPARYSSSRLPGKVLLPLHGRPMIQWVHELACDSGADEVIIATDNEKVAEVCRGFSAEVEMTSAEHHSGTDRLAEVVQRRDYPESQIIVNVQADEPTLPPALIRQVAVCLQHNPEASIATLCEPIRDAEQLCDPHVVKVVRGVGNHAIYFSRAPIPWGREQWSEQQYPAFSVDDGLHYRHIGLYAYRVGYLSYFSHSEPCLLEKTESLEQLRALHAGHTIIVETAEQAAGVGVDTAEDLERVLQEIQPG